MSVVECTRERRGKAAANAAARLPKEMKIFGKKIILFFSVTNSEARLPKETRTFGKKNHLLFYSFFGAKLSGGRSVTVTERGEDIWGKKRAPPSPSHHNPTPPNVLHSDAPPGTGTVHITYEWKKKIKRKEKYFSPYIPGTSF